MFPALFHLFLVFSVCVNDTEHLLCYYLKAVTFSSPPAFGGCQCITKVQNRFQYFMAKTESLRRSFFPQAIRFLNSNVPTIRIAAVYIPRTTCLDYYLLSLLYTVLHILFYCQLYSLKNVIVVFYFIHTYIYVYSLVFMLHIIALSMERT